jgi:hypothetical protein
MKITSKFHCSTCKTEVELKRECKIGPMLFERHTNRCSCSYCMGLKKKIGLWLPEDKSWNSWRVIYFKLFGYNFYLRWTLPKPKGL